MPCYYIACDGHLHGSGNLYYPFSPLERGWREGLLTLFIGSALKPLALRYTANLAINLERALTFREFFEHAF